MHLQLKIHNFLKDTCSRFLDFKTIKTIECVQFSPDTLWTVLLIDDKKYVLVETDYFDSGYEARMIENELDLVVTEWIAPKEFDASKYDDRIVFIGNWKYGLALVK